VKGLADGLEVIVLDVGVADDEAFFPLVNERENAIIGRDEVLGFSGNEKGATLGSDAGVHDDDVNSTGREVRVDRSDGEGSIEEIIGRDVVRDVYDVCFGIDFQDYALEGSNEMVVGAVIGS